MASAAGVSTGVAGVSTTGASEDSGGVGVESDEVMVSVLIWLRGSASGVTGVETVWGPSGVRATVLRAPGGEGMDMIRADSSCVNRRLPGEP